MSPERSDSAYHLELARRVYQLETIQEISLQINANRNVDEILTIILKSIIGTLGIAEAAAASYDAPESSLSIRIAQSMPCPEAPVTVSQETSALLAAAARPIAVDQERSVEELSRHRLGCPNAAYLVPISAAGRLLGAILLGPKLGWKPYTDDDLSFLRTIAAQAAVAVENAASYQQVREAEEKLRSSLAQVESISAGIIDAMVTVVEMRDPYTAGHQRRVSEIAVRIAEELGRDEETVSSVRMAGVIHDIGKISVPAEILAKPGSITDIEYSLIKTHAEIGYQILKTVEFPWPIAEIVLQHHECYDGGGYPNGLRGAEIHPAARILKVADTVEAAASHRPYRAGRGLARALGFVRDGRGCENDPEVVDACLRVFASGCDTLEDALSGLLQ